MDVDVMLGNQGAPALALPPPFEVLTTTLERMLRSNRPEQSIEAYLAYMVR